jgi:hypothetical protein
MTVMVMAVGEMMVSSGAMMKMLLEGIGVRGGNPDLTVTSVK